MISWRELITYLETPTDGGQATSVPGEGRPLRAGKDFAEAENLIR